MSKSDIFIYIRFELKFNQTSVNRWMDSLVKYEAMVHLFNNVMQSPVEDTQICTLCFICMKWGQWGNLRGGVEYEVQRLLWGTMGVNTMTGMMGVHTVTGMVGVNTVTGMVGWLNTLVTFTDVF